MSASFDGEAIKAMLKKLLDAKPLALQAAGVSLLTESQKSIINSGPGWPAFVRPPKRAHKLLFDTGLLLRSLAYDAGDNIFQQSENEVVVGTNVRYGVYQNQPIGKAQNLREYLFIDENRLELAKQAYLNTLQKAWDT